MYAHHFGLTAEPFSLTPDPEFLYLGRGHAEALAALKVAVLGARGLMVMSGEVGTGKTTLLYALLRAIGDEMRTAYVSNTTVGFDGLLRLALADFAVQPASTARIDLLTALNHFLTDCAEHGTTATLIIDEAQNLEVEDFEQVRLLSNYETFSHKLLQIVLVGQPELETRLREPRLRALTERIAVHCRLSPLDERESRAYLDFRLLRVGGSTRLFDNASRTALLDAAQGLPRRINILAHNALLFAYGRGLKQVTLPVARLAIAGRSALLADDTPAAPAVAAAQSSAKRFSRLTKIVGSAAAIAILVLVAIRAADDGPSPEARQARRPPPQDPVLVASADLRPATNLPAPDPSARQASAGSIPAAPMPEPAAPAAQPVVVPRERLVRVAVGANLERMVRDVYGTVDAERLRRVLDANPQVSDPNVIVVGDLLHFPEDQTQTATAQGSASHE